MRLELTCRRKTQKNHEAKFSIIQIWRDEIDKKKNQSGKRLKN